MDLGIGSGYVFSDPKEGGRKNGIADTAIKLKSRWMDEKNRRPAFTVSGLLKIPTASESKGLGSGQTDFGINTIFTKRLSQKWAIHLFSVLIGTCYSISGKILWDAGLKIGMNKAAPDFRMTTGFTWLFKP